MIQSDKLKAPLTSKAASMRDINNAIVDSGIRYGNQEFTVTLTALNAVNGVTTPELKALDELTVDVNGTTYATAFATDTQTTVDNLAALITADALVEKAVSLPDFKILIKTVENIEIVAENAGVTNSTTNQFALEETQEVRLLVALNVVNQDAVPILRVDIVGSAPNTTTYTGYSLPGAVDTEPVWKISETVETAATVTVKWADGNEKMDNIWTNRATTITYL